MSILDYQTRSSRWWQLAVANWPVVASVVLLSVVGIISIWADAPREYYWSHQLVYFVIAIICMAAVQGIHFRILGRWAWVFFVFSCLLVLYTVIGAQLNGKLPGVHNINGAFNWITFGGFSFQPSELLKVAFVMVLARYLRYRVSDKSAGGLLAPFMLALVPIGLILKQPDLGTALIFLPTLLAMLFVAGARAAHLVIIMLAGLALAPVVWLAGPAPEGGGVPVLKHLPVLIKPYQRARVYAMFSNDAKTLQETGYQQHNALLHFGSGGVAGKGAGHIARWPNIPEAHNDMIFALVGEQFGFVGSAIVLGAYLMLFAAGIEIAAANKDPFGKLLAAGIVSQLAAQAFLNLTVALKLMPVTGVTLPFISYGGSSLLASFLSAGLLLNIGQNRPIMMGGPR